MSRLTELNQALRRQSSRTTWIPELATPTAAFGQCLQRNATPQPSAGTVGLPIALLRAVVRAVRRRRTVRMLRQLDAHLLADIGIERYEIDKVAAKAAKAAKAVTPVVAAGPVQRFLVELTAALRKGWQRQAAIRSLQSLPDNLLADIGIERGRIPESVDSLLAQSQRRPAVRPEPAVAPVVRKPVVAAAPAHRVAA